MKPIYKQGIIVGVVTTLASFVIILLEQPIVSSLLKDDSAEAPVYLHHAVNAIAGCLFLSSLSMILGIVMKRSSFMVPWLGLMALLLLPIYYLLYRLAVYVTDDFALRALFFLIVLDSKGSVYQHMALIVAASLLALSSGLMIYGVFKKRPVFLLPWLILMSLGSTLFIMATFMAFVHALSYHYNGFLLFLLLTGFDIIILYPVYGLYFEMRAACAESLKSIEVND